MRELITPWTMLSLAICVIVGLVAGLVDDFPVWGVYLGIIAALAVAIPTVDRWTERPHR